MLAALHAIAALGETPAPLSQLLKPYSRYVSSGEINSEVTDTALSLSKIEADFGSRSDVTMDGFDGLTITASTWWFNVRASNTEPLLRLNVEADTEAKMVKIRDEVLAAIRK